MSWPTKEERQAHKGPWMARVSPGMLVVGNFFEDDQQPLNSRFVSNAAEELCCVWHEKENTNLICWPINEKTGMRVAAPTEIQQSNGLALLEFIETLRKEGYTSEQIVLLLDAQISVVPSPDGAPLMVSSKEALTQAQSQQLTRVLRRYQATGAIIYNMANATELSTPTLVALATQLYEVCKSEELSGVPWDALTTECRESWLTKARRFSWPAVFEKVEQRSVFTLVR